MRIGLSQRILYHRNRAYDGLEHGWYRFLAHHTLIPVANVPQQDFTRLAMEIDALVITGGDDSPARRLTEIKLATEVTKQHKPVVGVCHGAFLLTEILGGTVETCSGHYDQDHLVSYWDTEILVNSYHGLCIRQTPPGARVLCRAPDRTIESWVQGSTAVMVWHPERMLEPFVPNEIADLLEV